MWSLLVGTLFFLKLQVIGGRWTRPDCRLDSNLYCVAINLAFIYVYIYWVLVLRLDSNSTCSYLCALHLFRLINQACLLLHQIRNWVRGVIEFVSLQTVAPVWTIRRKGVGLHQVLMQVRHE